MRKLLPVLGALLILIVACPPIEPLDTPNVTATALTGGDTLRLTWTAISGASGYYVYLDGVKNTVSGTSFDVGTPAKVIEVTAYSGSTESDKWTLNTQVVTTATLDVAMVGNTNPNQAFYFNTSGTALAIPLTQATDIDFVMDTDGTSPELRSPDAYTPPYNSEDNASATTTTTDFDTYETAEAPGVYMTARVISSGAVYALWIDPTNNGWSTYDHFAKVKVEGISSQVVTVTLGYQKVGGLRWVISQ